MRIDFNCEYNERLSRHQGILLNIPVIDEKVGGMVQGTLSIIAGYTGHFKTTMAINVGYYNTVNFNYNIVFITLEMSKYEVYCSLISLHSYHMSNFTSGISADRIRRGSLTQSEYEHIMNDVIPDLESKKGQVIILDETDFKVLSPSEISNVLECVDKKLDGQLDAFIVDYIQLFKYSDSKIMDDNKLIGVYVSFFRRLCQRFGMGKNRKMLIGILLSQINRDGWRRADKRDGLYDLTAIVDANEIERSAYRVITLFSSEKLKFCSSIKVQVLKNRGGQSVEDPQMVDIEPDYYFIGDRKVNRIGCPNQYINSDSFGLDLSDDFSILEIM